MIIVNGARLYNTYFLQAYPPLALLSTWVLTEAVTGVAAEALPRRRDSRPDGVLLVQRSYASKVVGSALEDLERLRGQIE